MGDVTDPRETRFSFTRVNTPNFVTPQVQVGSQKFGGRWVP